MSFSKTDVISASLYSKLYTFLGSMFRFDIQMKLYFHVKLVSLCHTGLQTRLRLLLRADIWYLVMCKDQWEAGEQGDSLAEPMKISLLDKGCIMTRKLSYTVSCKWVRKCMIYIAILNKVWLMVPVLDGWTSVCRFVYVLKKAYPTLNCVYLRVRFYIHFQVFRYIPGSSAAAVFRKSQYISRKLHT